MRTLIPTVALALVSLSLPASGGIVIVNDNEWPLASGAYAAQFGANIANYFAGGPGG